MFPHPEPALCFKHPKRESSVDADDETDEREDSGDKGEIIICARCGARITDASARVEINHAHEHYFVNPHGYDFYIGCFAIAPGCIPHGKTSSEFTWFPGHTWQLDSCRGCAFHLGWMFRSPNRHFHGLIIDRLIEVEESPDDDDRP